jgi:hypothetical protein
MHSIPAFRTILRRITTAKLRPDGLYAALITFKRRGRAYPAVLSFVCPSLRVRSSLFQPTAPANTPSKRTR